MRPLVTAVSLPLVLLLVSNVSANQKERDWQTGKVLDASRDSVYAGDVGSASGSATTSGNTTYGNASGTSTAVYRVYETYTIAVGDYVYVCQEHIKWRWSKPAKVTVNGPVQVAIEKDHLYIKGEDGSEHSTKIIEKVLKATEPPEESKAGAETKAPPRQAPATGPLEVPAAIAITSNPDSSEIYVDGSFVGDTPTTLKLAAGKHAIRVTQSGYKDWSKEITVFPGSEVRLAATLEKQN